MARRWTRVTLAAMCAVVGLSVISGIPIVNADPTEPVESESPVEATTSTTPDPVESPSSAAPVEPTTPATTSPSAKPTSVTPTATVEVTGGASAELGSVSMSEIRKKLDELEAQQRELAAKKSASAEKLTAAQNSLSTTRTQISAQREDMAKLEAQLTQIALQQYQDRGLNSTAVIMTSNSTDDFLNYLAAMQQVSDTTNTLFTALQIEQGTLAELERGEKVALDTIKEEQKEIAKLEMEARQKIAETSSLLNSMSGMATVRVGSSLGGYNAVGRGVSDPWKIVPNPSSSLISPLARFVVTSPYGMRVHPISGSWSFHDGYDMAASCGTPVLSPANGYVIDYYWAGGYGNRLVIDHGIVNGRHVVTSHNHLSAGVAKPGTTVVQGQVVALVGTTGASTGCHDHYMIWLNGEIVDPAPYTK